MLLHTSPSKQKHYLRFHTCLFSTVNKKMYLQVHFLNEIICTGPTNTHLTQGLMVSYCPC